MLWAYEAQEVYEVYEVQELNFRESVVNAFHRCGLLPPPRAVPLPRRGRSLGRENRELAECRRARDARPYTVAENRNGEMRLQRLVASLQR